MRELRLVRSRRLAWGERAEPVLEDVGDAIVRPFLAGRCDGDTMPIHRRVSRALQVGMALRLVDPVVGCICGRVPFKGPFADHMLVPVPAGVPSERGAAASDNLADAWRCIVPPLAKRPGAARTRRRRTAARGNRRGCGHGYDVVVEATSGSAGLREALRALAPGGVCTAVGYYLASGTRVPAMRMYATSATLRVGVSHARAVLPELLAFIERTEFPAERVTTLAADWEDAPRAYAARTTKVVLQRDPLT
jgi:hypothetical protein